MTIIEVKKSVVVLNQKQMLNIKGGTDDSNATAFIIIEDVDEL